MFTDVCSVQVLELEGEKGEWGFKALKQMIKINFKLVSLLTYFIILNVSSYRTGIFLLFFNPADQLSRDDEPVQAAPHLYPECCDQELL